MCKISQVSVVQIYAQTQWNLNESNMSGIYVCEVLFILISRDINSCAVYHGSVTKLINPIPCVVLKLGFGSITFYLGFNGINRTKVLVKHEQQVMLLDKCPDKDKISDLERNHQTIGMSRKKVPATTLIITHQSQ